MHASETHGVDLIRKIAIEKSNDETIISRIWSEEMQSWGFFSNSPTEGDVFMIMLCSKPGDMFRSGKHWPYLFTSDGNNLIDKCYSLQNPYIILGLEQFTLDNTSVLGLKMLATNPEVTCQLISQYRTMFKIAWQYMNS